MSKTCSSLFICWVMSSSQPMNFGFVTITREYHMFRKFVHFIHLFSIFFKLFQVAVFGSSRDCDQGIQTQIQTVPLKLELLQFKLKQFLPENSNSIANSNFLRFKIELLHR